LKKRSFKALIISLVAIIALATGVGATIFIYSLNQTVPATVTYTEPTQNVDVQLASDITGTPFAGTLDFGTHLTTGVPQTALYFDATKIDKTTINVTSDIAGATLNWIVGTPSGSTGFCPIALFLTAGTPGTINFNITVTGTTL